MDAMVFGATGFLGRSLVVELLAKGQRVAAAVRKDTLTPWLHAQNVDTSGLTVVTADITRPLSGLPQVRDVYNTAGRYAFGLSVEEARAANVTGALNVLEWAATLPELRRLVHVSGYRVSNVHPDYAHLGAYEASKAEGDREMRARAAELGVPLSMANPSSVIGPGQYIGLGSLVRDLWNGRLPALPGGPDVVVPIVTTGYFSRFLAEIPASPEVEDYWVLDESTPPLPELVGTVAAHLGVRAPRRTIPLGLLRRLPRKITGADPETLSFLSADRYPTGTARALAARTGLRMPPAGQALRAWTNDLVAGRFGAAQPWLSPYGFRDRTWTMGEAHRPAQVLLHGLPMNADLWAPVAAHLSGPILAADLPGLGRSAATDQPTHEWLADLMAPVRTRPALVAHSAAAGPALRFAVEHPDRISKLVLVAPAFLQAPSPWLTRSRLAVPMLRRMSAARLAATLGLPEGPEVASAAADLRRPGAAGRVIAAMRASFTEREATLSLLRRVIVPVEILVGSADPLTMDVDHPMTELAGAGHYPQLTHPAELARHLEPLTAPTAGTTANVTLS
ncbi:alpha/beta fold hydrolase [Nonomuraea sp. NPDC050310]|uniref:alpha/beta fold hydrolase n=1 Tax=Nonomuraea sp. NPDC050310 TaxID=3154935 RepID=UPI0033ED3A87